MEPDIFKAIISLVPGIDKIQSDSGECGDSAVKEEYLSKLEYAPYQNIKSQNYPAIYATSGLNDIRVNYSEPLKLIAKLREYNFSSNPIILKAYSNRGHFRVQERFQNKKDFAEEYAFICRVFGIRIAELTPAQNVDTLIPKTNSLKG